MPSPGSHISPLFNAIFSDLSIKPLWLILDMECFSLLTFKWKKDRLFSSLFFLDVKGNSPILPSNSDSVFNISKGYHDKKGDFIFSRYPERMW